MGDYFRIETGFWSGPEGRRVRSLGLPAAVVRAYLRTATTASPFGLYYLPLPMLCHETGLGEPAALEALRVLEGAGVAFYDLEHEVVWVPAMAVNNIDPITSGRDKRARWVEKELRALEPMPFYDRFVARFRRDFHAEPGRAAEPPPKDHARPSEGASGRGGRGSEGDAGNGGALHSSSLIPHPAITAAPAGGLRAPEEARRSIFDAACRGLGLQLKWNSGTSFQLDGIMREDPEGPEEVEAVARHYAGAMTPPAQPSWRAFCEKYGERRAQWQRARKPAAAGERTKRGDRPSSVPGMLYCDFHGGLYPAGSGCKGCAGEAGAAVRR